MGSNPTFGSISPARNPASNAHSLDGRFSLTVNLTVTTARSACTRPRRGNTTDLTRRLAKAVGRASPERALSLDEAAAGTTSCFWNASALLDEARLLAQVDRYPRAVALTVLALEELGKIPDLHDTAATAQVSGSADGWLPFWKRFRSHKSKQHRIAAYGKVHLSDSSRQSFVNEGPYENFLPDDLGRLLDLLKQRSFYVDFYGGAFVPPRDIALDLREVTDELHALALERLDSFAQLHASVSRSRQFLEHGIKLVTTGASDYQPWPPDEWWLTKRSDVEEVRIDLHSLAAHRSSAGLPDHGTFKSVARQQLEHVTTDIAAAAVDAEFAVLEQRMVVIDRLPAVGSRAVMMSQLLLGYAMEQGLAVHPNPPTIGTVAFPPDQQ